jgi:hypothetical protein
MGKNKVILTYLFNICSPSKKKIYLIVFLGKMILFLCPRQWRQKYVVPKIDSKAQRIMSGIKGFKINVLMSDFSTSSFLINNL